MDLLNIVTCHALLENTYTQTAPALQAVPHHMLPLMMAMLITVRCLALVESIIILLIAHASTLVIRLIFLQISMEKLMSVISPAPLRMSITILPLTNAERPASSLMNNKTILVRAKKILTNALHLHVQTIFTPIDHVLKFVEILV